MADGDNDQTTVDISKRVAGDKVDDPLPLKKARLSTENEEIAGAEFPSTLGGFKYHFNEEGRLEHTETGKPFEFVIKDDKFNQRRYEALGEVITDHVYGLLETEVGLKKITVPTDASNDEAKSFVFASKEHFDESDKVLVLIHGDGVVRAGQWARRLIVNDCLDSGTQLPYINRAQKLGYEILVLNTNLNRAAGKDGKLQSVRENSSPQKHVLYVWDNFLADVSKDSVAMVAHSFGGVCALHLAKERSDFTEKAFFVAFTDSVHSMALLDRSNSLRSWFAKNSINWVKSGMPLGTEIASTGKDSPRVSAGTTKHEETSWKSIDRVFKQLIKRGKPQDKTEL